MFDIKIFDSLKEKKITLIRLRNSQAANAVSKLDQIFKVVLDNLSVLHPEHIGMWLTLHDAFKASGLSTNDCNVFEWLQNNSFYLP